MWCTSDVQSAHGRMDKELEISHQNDQNDQNFGPWMGNLQLNCNMLIRGIRWSLSLSLYERLIRNHPPHSKSGNGDLEDEEPPAIGPEKQACPLQSNLLQFGTRLRCRSGRFWSFQIISTMCHHVPNVCKFTRLDSHGFHMDSLGCRSSSFVSSFSWKRRG